MSSPAELSSLVLTRRLADGTIEWIPLAEAQRIPAARGEAYALIDRSNYEAPQKLVARRRGDDLLVEVDATEVLVLGGFFATPAAAFYPAPDVAGGAGPFSGPLLNLESPLLDGVPEDEQLVWTAEPYVADEPEAAYEPLAADEPAATVETAETGASEPSVAGAQSGGGGAGSPLLWGGLAAGALGIAALAGGGGGGGGGSSGSTGPTITSGATAQSIPENSGAGQVVYTATATGTGTITWSLATGGDAAAFSINASSGAVTLTENPDFETKSSYSFTVVATDTAGNRSQRTVTLGILDQDDAGPFITSGATATPIDENSDEDQVVYTATATHDDAFTWSLAAGGDAASFEIDPDTGEVTLLDAPDFETQSSYTFTVVATDTEDDSSQQTVTLAINNLDEADPTITSGATAPAIDENSGAGQVIYTATADDDGDISGGVTFSIAPGGDANDVTIDPTTGAVTLTANPDHETESRYDFTVVATDAAGNSDEQAVRLDINDLDDTAPTITSPGTAPAINENSGANQLVYTVTSTDSGDVSTGSTTYSLRPVNDASAFTINANTGQVRLTANPNFETKSSYSFTVAATDAAGNSSERAVSLSITNLDEVAPTITSGGTAPAITENSGANQIVYTVTSTDTGDISTGSTTYGLSPTGDAAAFTISATTGVVRLIANPDYEAQSSYAFTVVATDAAGNSSQRAVTLAINNIVDETAPTVSSVALTSAVGAQNDTLNAGDTVSVTVTMSENTTVGGAPRIALNVGGSTEFASYVSGSGSTSLVFQYTVQPGDTDSNGIAIPTNALQLNGGSLTDAGGNAAVLTHASVPNNASFRVDTAAPSLSSSNPADNATNVPVAGDIVLTFNDEMFAGSGNITISNGTDTRVIAVTDGSQVTFSGNQVIIDPTADLESNSTYNVQIASGALTDEAGNPYAGIANATTLNFRTEIVVDTSVVVFDLIQGSSSSHSGRTFQSGVSYDIYIRVDSDNDNLSTGGGGPGNWGTWAGTANLGSDDRVILVGNGPDVEGAFGPVTAIAVAASAVVWQTAGRFVNPGQLQGATFTRAVGIGGGDIDSAVLFNAPLPGAFLGGQGGALNTMYLANMPAGILTSQGLA